MKLTIHTTASAMLASIAVVALVLLYPGHAVHAQSPYNATAQPPVVVALVEHLPELSKPYAAVILRRAGGGDVILLPRSTANSALLDSAIRTLLHSGLALGMRPTAIRGKPFKEISLGVNLSEAPHSWRVEHGATMTALFDQLQTADPLDLPGIGRVPAIVFIPPSPPRRAATRE